MSKCTVAVTVDGWEAMGDVAPTFSVGQPITGTVHVWVNAAVQCDGLDVQLVPVRTTQGYFLGLDLPSVRIFEGKWEPGEYDYRFSIPSPWLPSHQGRHLGWKWIARATADIPWAIDPKGESEFRLEFAETPTALEITPAGETTESSKSSGSGKFILPLAGVWVLSLLMIAIGLAGPLLELGHEEVTDNIGGAGLFVCIFSLMALGATSARGERSERSSSSIDRVALTHRHGGGDYRSGGGSFIDCNVSTNADIDTMVARLVVEEFIEWRTRKNDHTTVHRHHHVIHQQDAPLMQDVATGSWHGSLRVPEPGSVPYFSVGKPPGHGIVWKVELSTSLAGKVDSEVTRRFLDVRPVVA